MGRQLVHAGAFDVSVYRAMRVWCAIEYQQNNLFK